MIPEAGLQRNGQQQEHEERDPWHIDDAADCAHEQRTKERSAKKRRDVDALKARDVQIPESAGQQQEKSCQAEDAPFDEELEVEIVDVPREEMTLRNRKPVNEPGREVPVLKKLCAFPRAKARVRDVYMPAGISDRYREDGVSRYVPGSGGQVRALQRAGQPLPVAVDRRQVEDLLLTLTRVEKMLFANVHGDVGWLGAANLQAHLVCRIRKQTNSLGKRKQTGQIGLGVGPG